MGWSNPALVFCPPNYHPMGPPTGVTARPIVGERLPPNPRLSRTNLADACAEAKALGYSLLVNLFLDETAAAIPIADPGLGLAHVLHRPGELSVSPEIATRLFAAAERDLFVVHTVRGLDQARNLLPRGATITHLPWPTATSAEIADRFATSEPIADRPKPVAVKEIVDRGPDDPDDYLLVIGGARADKGITTLLEAIRGGPPLRIAGETAREDEHLLSNLDTEIHLKRDRRWVPRSEMEDAIRKASVVMFPYRQEFALHGGASGALAQAITFARPMVVSDVLHQDVPHVGGCLTVPPDDPTALRAAIDQALATGDALRRAAQIGRAAVDHAHSYEDHLRGLVTAWSARADHR